MWLLMVLFPIWILVSKISKNIVIDGIIFDVLLTVSYTISILYFTSGIIELTKLQYFGIIFILFGLFLIK